jgi:hypothetical protein
MTWSQQKSFKHYHAFPRPFKSIEMCAYFKAKAIFRDFAKFVVLFHPKSPVQNILQLPPLWTCLDIVIGFFLWLKIALKQWQKNL